MDPYETLGVEPDATLNKIKKAYRFLSNLHHPDKGGDAEIFSKVAEAYAILSDPEKREQYDNFGDTPIEAIRDRAMGIFMEACKDVDSSYSFLTDLEIVIDANIKGLKENADRFIKENEEEIKALTKIQSKIRKAPEHDFLKVRLEGSIQNQRNRIAEHEKVKKLLIYVGKMLKGYKFNDPEEKATMESGELRMSDLSMLGPLMEAFGHE